MRSASLFGLRSYLVSITNKRGISWRTVLWGLALQLILASSLWSFRPEFGDFSGLVTAYGSWVLPRKVRPSSLETSHCPPDKPLLACACHHDHLRDRLLLLMHGRSTTTASCRFRSGTASHTERTDEDLPIESINAVGEIFLGQTESPLLVKRYIPYISSSELFAMMGGFATIAGSTMGGLLLHAASMQQT
ncbi:MAG: hypothetical protein IPM83_11535 [Ignavibacteria bacterium]|nr:hypothetical protein [Ignavibacteria bacterium]